MTIAGHLDQEVPLSSKTWFWLSSAWMALARLGKAAPYSTLTFLLLAPAGISDRLELHLPY